MTTVFSKDIHQLWQIPQALRFKSKQRSLTCQIPTGIHFISHTCNSTLIPVCLLSYFIWSLTNIALLSQTRLEIMSVYFLYCSPALFLPDPYINSLRLSEGALP